jgi:hypothetical protein
LLFLASQRLRVLPWIMPNHPPRPRPADMNRRAWEIVREATGETSPVPETSAARRGRLGGLKGGRSRATKLTAAERSAIAKKAAAARWGNRG